MENIKEQLVQLFFKVRNLSVIATSRLKTYPTGLDINMSEFFLMRKAAAIDFGHAFSLHDIQESLCISKSGISKMLAALEKKGYLLRDTDRSNRRNLVITLTEKGTKTMERLENFVDNRLSEYIALIGEDDLKQLFLIINRMEERKKAITSCNDFFLDKDMQEDD